MTPRLSTWERGAVAVERGPLVFSLRLDEQWTPITQGMKHPAPPPAKDWEVTSKSPWNYGLVAADASRLRVEEKAVGDFRSVHSARQSKFTRSDGDCRRGRWSTDPPDRCRRVL